MKKQLFYRLIFLLLFPFAALKAQKVELQMSPKPAILVNGNNCSIWNTIWSCTTRVCDSVVITAGDSVEFCTHTEIYLNTDTAYWIEWNFPGSNYPDSVYHHYPYQTPHCIYPRWDIPGDYYCDVYYNGWLSAYPNSDCYPVPSHWIVHVIVLANPNGISSHELNSISISPNPSSGIFLIKNNPHETALAVYDLNGNLMLNKTVGEDHTLDLSLFADGIYILQLTSGIDSIVSKLVVVHN